MGRVSVRADSLAVYGGSSPDPMVCARGRECDIFVNGDEVVFCVSKLIVDNGVESDSGSW